MERKDVIIPEQTKEVMGRKCRVIAFNEKPISLEGFPFWEGKGPLCRLPLELVDKVNDGVAMVAWDTSGGMIRFISDTCFLGARVKLKHKAENRHMTRTGDSGLDFYIRRGEKALFFKTVTSMSADCSEMEYDCMFDVQKEHEIKEWTIILPLYNGIRSLELLIEPGSKIINPSLRSIEKPVLFYGSSITQGGCASRPGNSYPNMISRWLDVSIVNLGFSGSAIGEKVLAELISNMEISAFVMDYDLNAPNPEHLEATHEIFFRIIRQAQPNLPIIMLSMPPSLAAKHIKKRKDIVYKTYKNALDDGDRNVYFIDGSTLYPPECADECTVDGTHPNDLGFYHIAQKVLPVIREAIKKNKNI